MAQKYSCTKCGKKFVDWGAKKIKAGDGCDDCKGEFLELVGFDAAQAAPKKKPALKRRRAAAAKKKPKPAASEDGILEPDLAAEPPDGTIDDVSNLNDAGTDADDVVDLAAGKPGPKKG